VHQCNARAALFREVRNFPGWDIRDLVLSLPTRAPAATIYLSQGSSQRLSRWALHPDHGVQSEDPGDCQPDWNRHHYSPDECTIAHDGLMVTRKPCLLAKCRRVSDHNNQGKAVKLSE